jgi:hypothetical protein
MTFTLQKVTGPEPAAGAVHRPEMLVLALASLCVTPLQEDCVREPVLPSMVPALVSEAELKDAPKKAPSTKPLKEPLAREIATRY